MSKPGVKQRLSDKKKASIVIIVLVLLAIPNVIPLRYSDHYNCPQGGSHTVSGVRVGFPTPYAGTQHGGINTCPGYYSDPPSRGFSISALFTDALVFGVVMIGVNVLLDRRTDK